MESPDLSFPGLSFLLEEDISAPNPSAPSAPPASPPPVQFTLPTLPPPTLSRSSSTTHLRITRLSGAPPSSPGLDMSASPRRYQSRYGERAEEARTPPVGSPARDDWGDAGPDLDDEIQRTRRARAVRQSRHQSLTVESALASPTPSTPFSTTTPATPSLYPSAPSRSTMDPRDSASTRENMTALLAASGASVGGPVVGLAGMFGGSAKPPPLHRVNSTFTELEQAEMEKLEVEMASKRKHYGDVEVEVPPPRAAGGLAALMQAKSAGDSAVGERVARRWGPPEPVKAASAPTPLAASSSPAPASYDFSSAKAGSYGSNSFPSTTTTSTTTTPRPTPAAAVSFPSYGNQGPSPLAAAMGSKASGPRLNQPAPTPVADEGPAHARSRGGGGAVAMPGMVAAGTVRERTRSFTNSSVPSPVVEASRPAPKQLDSVEGGVRERRTSFPSAAIPAPKRVESVEAKIVSRSPPKDEEVFKRPSSPTKFAGGGAFTSEPASISMNKNGPTPSLTRLQSSSIVSERLKSSQLWEQEEASIPEVTTKPGAVKRRSVLERWGRDSPDSSTSAGAPPASKVEREADVKLVGGFGAEGGKGLAVGSEGPALIQLNRDRARPPKSTPRSLPVQHDQPMHEPAELPASYSDAPLPPLDSSTTRSDPSPRFDSPVADSNWGETLPMSREPSALDITPQAWTGPPIGVKEVAKPTSSFTRDDEAPPVKHSRGVALPGMSAPPPDPTMSRLIASQYETSRGIQEIKISPRYVEADRPSAMDVASSISQATAPPPISIPAETNPWSRPTPNATTTSPDRPSPSFVAPATPQPRVRPASVFTTAKIIWRAEVDDDVPPPSPSVSVRDAAALWGAPARSTPAASIAIKESYGVKVSSRPASVDFSARPAPSAARRQPSVDFGALRAAYASPAPTPASEPPRLSRQPSKPQLASSPSSSSSPIELFAVRSSSLVPIKPGRTFSHDVLVVVDRTAPVSGTKVWVWTGVEAALDEAILEQLKKEHRTTPSVVSQRRESPELVNRLGSPLIICKGTRDSFDEHDSRLFRAEALGDTVVLDELPLWSTSLCAGYSFVLTSVGDVFVWHGKGSSTSERSAAESVARGLAAGRPVTILFEGREPDYFWDALGGGTDYASAHYWRFRPTYPLQVSVLAVNSSGVSRRPTLALDPSAISIVESTLEYWTVVPQGARNNREDLRTAISRVEELASQWKARGLPFRPPHHVLYFPTAIPRDLVHLSRQLDFEALNGGATTTRLDVKTAREARDELL